MSNRTVKLGRQAWNFPQNLGICFQILNIFKNTIHNINEIDCEDGDVFANKTIKYRCALMYDRHLSRTGLIWFDYLNHQQHPLMTHRIHGAGIYANIWGILMVNDTIYSSTMDPSWVMFKNQFQQQVQPEIADFISVQSD